MNKVLTSALAVLLGSAMMAQAGGIDRSGQSVGILFEEGSYAEFSYGFVNPSISGVDALFGDPTGDLAPSYSMLGFSFKTDLSDQISAALIYDQPFGGVVDYPEAGSIYELTTGNLTSNAVTLMVSYDISDRFVIYGGASYQTMAGTAALSFYNYTLDAAASSGFGYVVGGAFQIPDIALRVALTYRSEITTDHAAVETGSPDAGDSFAVTTPQSVNLEFQSGINPKTLIFGSVRWVDWSAFYLLPPDFIVDWGRPLLEYDSDVITYNIGISRKLSERLSAAMTLGYEAQLGGRANGFIPVDGFISVGAGVTYMVGAAEISAGARYLWLGDTAFVPLGTYEDNTAMAFGLKVGYSF